MIRYLKPSFRYSPSARILTDSRDGVKHAVLQGEAECSLVKKVKILKLYKGGACNKFPSLEREGDRRMSVESRIHYVNQKE